MSRWLDNVSQFLLIFIFVTQLHMIRQTSYEHVKQMQMHAMLYVSKLSKPFLFDPALDVLKKAVFHESCQLKSNDKS